MDWKKVIEKLRWFGQNSTEQANAARRGGEHEHARHHGERADLYYTLAAALDAGLRKDGEHPIDIDEFRRMLAANTGAVFGERK